MTDTPAATEVTLGQVLQSVRVPWTQAGGFLMALAYTCEQYGYINIALVIRNEAISIVSESDLIPAP